MGQKNCKQVAPIFPKTESVKSRYQNQFEYDTMKKSSHRSVSNPSLTTVAEDELKEVVVNLSEQFNKVYMDSLYEAFINNFKLSEGYIIPPDILKAISTIVETISLDDNILYTSNKMREITLVGENWSVQFGEFSHRNPIKFSENLQNSIHTKDLVHSMCVQRTLKFIVNYMEEGNYNKAFETLRLCALSHLVMRVPQHLYQIIMIRLIQTLLCCKILHEDGLPTFVFFVQKITGYMVKCTDEYINNHASLYYAMLNGSSSPSREKMLEEYFRMLKAWKTFVGQLLGSLNKPLKAMCKQIEEEREQFTNEEALIKENWKVIKCLKKGYKCRRNRLL